MNIYTNNHVLEIIMRFLNRYHANVRAIVEEKNNVVKEAQAKIDALKIEHIKKQINQYDKSGN